MTEILTANGVVTRKTLRVKMCIVDADNRPLTPWFRELAVVAENDNAVRLSGSAMRDHLYFAMAPGNAMLYVAAKKNGIVTLLPAM